MADRTRTPHVVSLQFVVHSACAGGAKWPAGVGEREKKTLNPQPAQQPPRRRRDELVRDSFGGLRPLEAVGAAAAPSKEKHEADKKEPNARRAVEGVAL